MLNGIGVKGLDQRLTCFEFEVFKVQKGNYIIDFFCLPLMKVSYLMNLYHVLQNVDL